MSSRSVFISTCVLAFLATPALPQAATSPLAQAGSVPAGRASFQSARPRDTRPLTLRAALRMWGLDRPSAQLRFNKRRISSDVAEFDTIVSLDDGTTTTTLENLVVRRSNVPGPSFGQFTIEGTKLVESDGTSIGAFSLTGVSGGSSLANLVNNFDAIDMGQPRPADPQRPNSTPSANAVVIDRLTMTDVATQNAGSQKAGRISLAEISFSDIILGDGVSQFDDLTLKNLVYIDADSEVKLGSLQLSDAGAAVSAILDQTRKSINNPFDIMQFALGGLSLNDLSMTFNKTGTKAPPLNSFALQNLRIGQVKQGFMDQFSFADLKVEGVAGRQRWQFSLARVGFTGINMVYIDEVSSYIQATFKAALANPNTPRPTINPARPRRVLKDLLIGGPLDGGFTGFDLADMKVSGGGLEFELDRVGFKQEHNPQGIVTRADFIPSQMRLTWPHPRGSGANQIATFLASLNTTEIVARVVVASSFEPATDRLTLDSYRFEVVNWGSIDFGFTMSGFSAFMEKTSFSDFIKLSTPQGSSSGAVTKAAVDDMLAMYSDISINSAQMAIVDSGGLDKTARLIGSQGTRAQAATPVTMTADQVRELRSSWAQKPRESAGNKARPAMERLFGIALARWLENGGTMKFATNPARPIAMTELAQGRALSVERLGLAITHQPPPNR